MVRSRRPAPMSTSATPTPASVNGSEPVFGSPRRGVACAPAAPEPEPDAREAPEPDDPLEPEPEDPLEPLPDEPLPELEPPGGWSLRPPPPPPPPWLCEEPAPP